MPALQKKVLSLYLRTGCRRQLALNLYSDAERRANGMPERQQARAGLGLVGRLGYEWQDEKVSELADVFGRDAVHVSPVQQGNRPAPTPLADVLPRLQPYQFVVECKYDPATPTFKEAVGLAGLTDLAGRPLDIGATQPDLIQVLPPAAARAEWEAVAEDEVPPVALQAVLPTGDVMPLPSTDLRLRLRVIDIKLAAEPGAHYFAEVVYYSITLAAWLVEHGWDDRFVVIAAPAVWPGSYDASHIRLLHNRCRKEGRTPAPEELARALEDDIEVAPFDAFAPRLLRFFREELPLVLQTPWEQLPWHVSYLCGSCEFLGYPWIDSAGRLTNSPLHCWPTAEKTHHLSRVAGLSRGSAQLLGPTAADVGALAMLSAQHEVFDSSPSLRAKRTLYPHRARALEGGLMGIVPNSGSDALMPRWPDLHIYLFLDYDLASAITATFSLRAFWRESLPWGSPETPQQRRWAARAAGEGTDFQEVFLVDQRSLPREQEELLKFLRAFRGILTTVEQQDEADIANGRRGDPAKPDKLKRTTYQIYLWDEAQRKQLTRVIGRHLPAILADSQLRDLAWLFPPPELLAHPEEASYKSPFTFVSAVVQNTIAVPVPHHYTLLAGAQAYHSEGAPEVSVHPLYREPLSDLIPGERLHEMWTRRGNYTQTQRTIEETTTRKLTALQQVVERLERDLRDILARAAAPPLRRSSPHLAGLPPQSVLWYEYTRLNLALQELETVEIRAMPAHERVARYKSAQLTIRLEGAAKQEAYHSLQEAAPQSLPPPEELLIYRLSADSVEFNIRPPTLGFALAPRSNPAFLAQAAFPLLNDHGVKGAGRLNGTVAEAGLTEVTVVAIDRVHGLIAVKPGYKSCILPLETSGAVDFRTDLMLDPISDDFLSKKLRLTLQGIGWPASAGEDAVVIRALGLPGSGTLAVGPETPASEFLWQAPRLAQAPVAREVAGARARLEACGERLNSSQWQAWEAALTCRLALIWGPPGTGKSQTVRAVIAGAGWHAHAHRQPLRVLITANTYTAIDNVLFEADLLLAQVCGSGTVRLYRLQSESSDPPAELQYHPAITPIVPKTAQTPDEVQALQVLLDAPDGIVVVAGTPHQLHNLAIATRNKTRKETSARTQRRWFDLLIIDEASQFTVAEATLAVSKAAEDAAFVLAGDDKQLPPIQPAIPPEKLEHLVGSVYSYVRHHHQVAPQPLQINYRACQTLVDFTKRAGYDPGLHAYHTELRLAVLPPGFPADRPADWPDELYWTADWIRLLDPQHQAVCFIYEDPVSGQSNPFEADAVAALLWLLYGRLDRQLAGERRGANIAALAGWPHDETSFWERAVGVVTPHRAQMSRIVTRLQGIFPRHSRARIWNAVDTVERFQGQQRDVIIASFGLGDLDLIRSEDEFLYSLNRFNVMASRARAKLIVLLTRTLLDHLADDAAVLAESRLLKNYAESFCQAPIAVTLGLNERGITVRRPGILRSR